MSTIEPEANEQDTGIEDLDVDEQAADGISGGRARTADPCEGGE